VRAKRKSVKSRTLKARWMEFKKDFVEFNELKEDSNKCKRVEDLQGMFDKLETKIVLIF